MSAFLDPPMVLMSGSCAAKAEARLLCGGAPIGPLKLLSCCGEQKRQTTWIMTNAAGWTHLQMLTRPLGAAAPRAAC